MFNMSKCHKCGGTFFKLVTQEPTGSNYKVNFVQCSSCDTPIGVLDYFNIGSQLETQKETISKIDQRLANIESLLYQIAGFLNNQHR